MLVKSLANTITGANSMNVHCPFPELETIALRSVKEGGGGGKDWKQRDLDLDHLEVSETHMPPHTHIHTHTKFWARHKIITFVRFSVEIVKGG